ncbi:MAG: hypothetical protein KF751_03810 [Nitrospira sp.]|nr:hypothetical protein [Nitrospira sp.]
MNKLLSVGVLLLTLITLIIFLASCVITLTDGQGALVFVVSIPAMSILLFCALMFSRKLTANNHSRWRIDYFPKIVSAFLIAFFVSLFIPALRKLPDTVMNLVGTTFTYATGTSLYAFFKERASLPTKLSAQLQKENQKTIIFSDLDVTFAWDRVCIFGPYTNNEKVKSVLNMNWNIEERSQIHVSDSVNALVFLYQGSVNQVVDLKRGITNFTDLDMCLSRNQANFKIRTDASGRRILTLESSDPSKHQ